MKKITITRDRKGKITVVTEGFTGEGCLQETAALEAAFGMDQRRAELTEEYHGGEAHALEENAA